MVNTDYKIDAISILLREDCILKGFYPLIPYRNALVENLRLMGCQRKSEAQKCSDQALLQAGVPEALLSLLRKFLVLYDPRLQKMREIGAVSESAEEEAAFRELYLLPGVKCTRARLYLRAGFGLLEKMAAASAEELIAACEQAIASENLSQKAPLLKEARTHIAVAKAFTDAV